MEGGGCFIPRRAFSTVFQTQPMVIFMIEFLYCPYNPRVYANRLQHVPHELVIDGGEGGLELVEREYRVLASWWRQRLGRRVQLLSHLGALALQRAVRGVDLPG